MIIAPVRTVAPVDLLDTTQVAAALDIDLADVDELTMNRARAAVGYFDGVRGILGRALVTQTWTFSTDLWAETSWELPLLDPIQSVSSVQYWDSTGTTQVLSGTMYRLSGNVIGWASSFGRPSLTARGDAITATFVAGYGAPEAVPPEIVEACVLKLKALHSQAGRDAGVVRETVYGVSTQIFGGRGEYDDAIMQLIQGYRRIFV